jgi:hypothetical protein
MFIPARQQQTMQNLLPALRRVSDGLKERGIRQAPIVGVELDELDGGDLGRGRHELFTRSGEEGRMEERKEHNVAFRDGHPSSSRRPSG